MTGAPWRDHQSDVCYRCRWPWIRRHVSTSDLGPRTSPSTEATGEGWASVEGRITVTTMAVIELFLEGILGLLARQLQILHHLISSASCAKGAVANLLGRGVPDFAFSDLDRIVGLFLCSTCLQLSFVVGEKSPSRVLRLVSRE